MSSALTVVAPLSVRAWYAGFCGAMDDVVFVGEGAEVSDGLTAITDELAARADGRPVRLFSGHDSLVRDWVLAQELRARGLTVASQSGMASSAALDKVLQKQLLAAAGLPTPDWGLGDTAPPAGARALWKGRASTQSRDISWRTESEPAPPDQYWERWIEGVEYSVVLHREHGHTFRFPAVWKGAVREDLSPPWQRLRLVPSGADPTLLAELDRISIRIAELVDLWGFGEVEFIVGNDGRPLVTDINPRICGTMRIVAMATGLAIFDPSALTGEGVPPAAFYAAEMPYSGPPVASPSLVATSRLTCAADSPAAALAVLAERGDSTPASAGTEPTEALPWPWRAH